MLRDTMQRLSTPVPVVRPVSCHRPVAPARSKWPSKISCSAASFAAVPSPVHKDAPFRLKNSSVKEITPTALPLPPKDASLAAIVPYLISLAVGDAVHLWRIALALMLIFTSKLAGLACPFWLKQAVDTLTTGSITFAPITLPGVFASPAVHSALVAVACFGLCDMIKHICKEAQAPVFLPVTQSVARRVTYHTFAHVLGLDVGFHLDKRTGRLSRILERGPRAVQQIYRAAIFVFLPTTLELVAVCTVLVKTFSPLVGGIVGATFAVYIVWSIALTQLATEVRKEVIELDNQTTSKAIDALLNFETVTLFNNQRFELGQYLSYIMAYQRATNRTEQLQAVLNAGQAIILAMGMASAMFAAVLVGRCGASATAGDLVMIQGLLLQLWAPLQFLGWLYRELKNAVVDISELVEIWRTTSKIQDGTQQLPHTHPAPALHPVITGAAAASSSAHVSLPSGSGADNGAAQLHTAPVHSSFSIGHAPASSSLPPAAAAAVAGLDIELRDVHFGYSAERKILHGVSLKVAAGQSVAIVGPSGSGKSTVLKLLTRQYDITSGAVLLQGVGIKDLTLDSLRAAVAVVPQETVLFNDTILENIRYGRPDADDEEVLEAARMARLDVAVNAFPAGFQTMVGERGLKLSGGEKQRVAIARAFLRSPRLLICDEATSALDTATEAQIIESLESLSAGRTSIFVAHRLSTVKSCDKIIVLQAGLVVESGSHAELMETEGGVYRKMWQRQVAEKRPDVGDEDWAGSDSDSDAGPGAGRSGGSSSQGGGDEGDESRVPVLALGSAAELQGAGLQ